MKDDKNITITNSNLCRKISDDKRFISAELYHKESSGHKYNIGDKCKLHGLIDFPEFNNSIVEITGIRCDGVYGKAYYIKGEINKYLNWVYEYRLTFADQATDNEVGCG